MKEKSLEQLVQHLRKAIPEESRPYLDELVLRTQASYVQAAIELEKTEMPTGGVHKPADLQHIKEGSLLIASIKQDNMSSYVVARKSWLGDGTRIHLLNESRDEIAPNLVEHFIPVAASYGTLTRDALIAQAKEYRRQITYMQESNREQNIELDALGYVWCTGNCTGGQFWHTEPQEVTPEMVSAVIGVAHRIAVRGTNTTNERIERQLKFFNEIRERRIKAFRGNTKLEERVRQHHLKLMDFKEATKVPEEVTPEAEPEPQVAEVLGWYSPVAFSTICGAIFVIYDIWRTLCGK